MNIWKSLQNVEKPRLIHLFTTLMLVFVVLNFWLDEKTKTAEWILDATAIPFKVFLIWFFWQGFDFARTIARFGAFGVILISPLTWFTHDFAIQITGILGAVGSIWLLWWLSRPAIVAWFKLNGGRGECKRVASTCDIKPPIPEP